MCNVISILVEILFHGLIAGSQLQAICLPLGLCKTTVSGLWKRQKFPPVTWANNILQIIQKSVEHFYWSREPIHCDRCILQPIFRPATHNREMEAMSHIPPTVLLPPSQDCVAVWLLVGILSRMSCSSWQIRAVKNNNRRKIYFKQRTMADITNRTGELM